VGLILGDDVEQLLVLGDVVHLCEGQHAALGAHLVVDRLLFDAQLRFIGCDTHHRQRKI
jgi:hypothetical protein